jgi:hypothetical protein
MSRTLELPDRVYEALLEAAGARGIAPADWIAEQLPSSPSPAEASAPRVTGNARQAALDRLLQHTVSLGRPTGSDSELIDADLAREYAASHDVPTDQGPN